MKIKYKLANGKMVEVEVTEVQAEVLVEINRKTESHERKALVVWQDRLKP